MILHINNQEFDTEDIRNLTITNTSVLIETEEDFYTVRYHKREDIQEALDYQHFKELTRGELQQAVNTIILTCEFFLNSKEQCSLCPLQRFEGCVFTTIPLDWRT